MRQRNCFPRYHAVFCSSLLAVCRLDILTNVLLSTVAQRTSVVAHLATLAFHLSIEYPGLACLAHSIGTKPPAMRDFITKDLSSKQYRYMYTYVQQCIYGGIYGTICAYEALDTCSKCALASSSLCTIDLS